MGGKSPREIVFPAQSGIQVVRRKEGLPTPGIFRIPDFSEMAVAGRNQSV